MINPLAEGFLFYMNRKYIQIFILIFTTIISFGFLIFYINALNYKTLTQYDFLLGTPYFSAEKSVHSRLPACEGPCKKCIFDEFCNLKSFVTLIAGDVNTKLQIITGQTLYEVLQMEENKDIIFYGKNYSGLGFFVTDIGTLHSGDGKYLFYYINSKEASVGVSSYLLKDGDIIEWELK
ncbi:MAG: hypothetical protein UU24_C0007G0015 [Candidatus Nomurabacteria bacterium GW2011_GWA2_40_9]|uniref:Transcobalamin-like C-terminal domain-containing protein n=1 Tax=Candidatus Nomurabacteria bacterium GW2011_GWA2_40_9 TaxID=1618734 RepID=A0A0G0TR75_9BACT|nr:MAG: hypothetical protein UU24_C0007G0015 [Candidatus Nomurabacteria bacterium GW2011_GWA2_40_9]